MDKIYKVLKVENDRATPPNGFLLFGWGLPEGGIEMVEHENLDSRSGSPVS